MSVHSENKFGRTHSSKMCIFAVAGSKPQTRVPALGDLTETSSCQGECQGMEDGQEDSHSGKRWVYCNFQ